ncbi:helix-turn-helix domain-containing protein [Paenibacillus cymbidii]|uniref:helix-turn-helix domain-containing protein n=1 Tax=Paenibacillus cymbidii TaxID=1639034 RepID=UPI0010806C8A|nr:AraC family transcriptional regulator [Paenibacillus cymbidii]
MSAFRQRSANDWSADSVRLIATPSAFARQALYYIQEIGHFRAARAYFTEREQLESFLVVYTVAGAGELTYRDQTTTVRPGDLFCIDCMAYQHYRTALDSREPWELLWVHLYGSGSRSYYELFAEADSPVVRLPQGSGIPALLRRLLDIQRNRSLNTELESSRLLVALLTDLLLESKGTDRDPAAAPAYILQLKQKLEQEYAASHSLDTMAAAFAVNKYHLARTFKRHTGFSPLEYLINTRITRAKELLQYGTLPVADIARAVGVDNASHFINLFKSRTGLTPLAFRNRWRQPD